jgi:hypothetical protein
MMTPTDYMLAWSIYLLAAGVLLLATWRLSRPLWSWLRDPLLVALAVIVLTPAAADGEGGHLAPSVFVVGYELLTAPEGGMGPLLGVRLLLFTIFAVLGVWSLRLLWHFLVSGRR